MSSLLLGMSILRTVAICLFAGVAALVSMAQVNTGGLRLTVLDPAGVVPKATVIISSEGNHYNKTFVTDRDGAADCERLPFGIYLVHIEMSGLAAASMIVDVHSARATTLRPISQ